MILKILFLFLVLSLLVLFPLTRMPVQTRKIKINIGDRFWNVSNGTCTVTDIYDNIIILTNSRYISYAFPLDGEGVFFHRIDDTILY